MCNLLIYCKLAKFLIYKMIVTLEAFLYRILQIKEDSLNTQMSLPAVAKNCKIASIKILLEQVVISFKTFRTLNSLSSCIWCHTYINHNCLCWTYLFDETHIQELICQWLRLTSCINEHAYQLCMITQQHTYSKVLNFVINIVNTLCYTIYLLTPTNISWIFQTLYFCNGITESLE